MLILTIVCTAITDLVLLLLLLLLFSHWSHSNDDIPATLGTNKSGWISKVAGFQSKFLM